MSIFSWFKRLAGKKRNQVACPPAEQPASVPGPVGPQELGPLEDRYTPALLDALRQLKELYLEIKVADESLKELAILEQLQPAERKRARKKKAGLKELAALQTSGRPQTADEQVGSPTESPAESFDPGETWRPPWRQGPPATTP